MDNRWQRWIDERAVASNTCTYRAIQTFVYVYPVNFSDLCCELIRINCSELFRVPCLNQNRTSWTSLCVGFEVFHQGQLGVCRGRAGYDRDNALSFASLMSQPKRQPLPCQSGLSCFSDLAEVFLKPCTAIRAAHNVVQGIGLILPDFVSKRA